MSILGTWQEKTRGTIFAGAFGAVALASYALVPQNAANKVSTVPQSVAVFSSVSAEADTVTTAVTRFVDGMAKKDPDAVWMFASEEDQAAFGTERAVYDAYAEAFPQLTDVAAVHVGTVRNEGDTPFVPVVLQNNAGQTWVADFGMWKNDAGDWTLISLDIRPASDNSV